MKQYSSYKDSDIEWIGEIPEHWDYHRIKWSLEALESGNRETGGGSQLDDGVFSIGGEHIGWMGELLLSNPKYISETYYDNLKTGQIKKNDVLLVKDGATIGKCTLIKELPFYKCAVNEHVFILRVNQEYDSRFLFYFIWCYIGQEQIKLEIRGAAQGGLNSQFINEVIIPITYLSEQQAIVDFLDKKTALIDELIEKKKRQIELLKEQRQAIINQAVTKGLDPNVKMKDSGIEWLGEIPEHWEVKKLKFISCVNLSNVDKKSKEDEQKVLLCNYLDVYNNEHITPYLNFMEATASSEQIKKFTLEQGDVLITKDSEDWADIAVPAYVQEDLSNVLCGYHLAHIRPIEAALDGGYLFHSFCANTINEQFKVSANGITRYGIGKYYIENSLFLLPPKDEQYSIVEFLNKKTDEIDNSISKAENQIQLLQEYRTALISEAVTGKIDVREN